MKGSKFSEEQVNATLREQQAGGGRPRMCAAGDLLP